MRSPMKNQAVTCVHVILTSHSYVTAALYVRFTLQTDQLHRHRHNVCQGVLSDETGTDALSPAYKDFVLLSDSQHIPVTHRNVQIVCQELLKKPALPFCQHTKTRWYFCLPRQIHAADIYT
ncbi:hypothetical protein BaRGS_00005819, partial [Batillaria attramentaria]